MGEITYPGEIIELTYPTGAGRASEDERRQTP